jgi:acetolactate synthase-1/2/3 large subunit
LKTKVRDLVTNILLQSEIEYIFGHTGDNILALWQSIKNTKIQTIFNKTEFGAVFMADGYSRASEKLGVILTTGGPGATNMITPLATAYLDSVPLLAISGGAMSNQFGRNAFQEGSGRGRSIEQRLSMKAVCKKAMLAPSPESVEDMLLDALREAQSGRPGPVYIEVPSDFWEIEVSSNYKTHQQYQNIVPAETNQAASEKILEKIYESSYPLVMIGEGALERNISQKIMAALKTLKIPFCVSPLGKNTVDEFDEYYLGSGYVSKNVHSYLKDCDFILQLGLRLQPDFFDNADLNKIQLAQVDSDPLEIGRSFPVDYSVVGSITSFLSIIPSMSHKNSQLLLDKINQINTTNKQVFSCKSLTEVYPPDLNKIVSELSPKDTVIVCDTGYTKARVVHEYRTNIDQKILVSDRNGCMGYSVPAAIGAAIAGDREVVCFCGDGGFQMSFNELGVALNYGLKVIYILENNGGCSSIFDYNMQVYGNHFMDTFNNPDFKKLAESYEFTGFTARTKEQFSYAFKEALLANNTVIINTHVSNYSTN